MSKFELLGASQSVPKEYPRDLSLKNYNSEAITFFMKMQYFPTKIDVP